MRKRFLRSLLGLPCDSVNGNFTQQIRPEARQPAVLMLAVDHPPALDSDALLPAQSFKILEGAQPYVGGVIPFIRQCFGFGHTSTQGQSPTKSPVGKVREGDNAFAAQPQHFIQNLVGPPNCLKCLGHQNDIKTAIIKVAQPLGVQILFDNGDATAHASGDMVRIDFQAEATGAPLALQEVEQSTVAAAQIQDVVAGLDPLLDDFEIRSHAPTSRATRSM